MKAPTSLKTTQMTKKFVLRLPADIHEKILLTAQQHRRSMNAEITHLLHEHLLQQSLSPTVSLSSSCTDSHDEQAFLMLFRALPEPKQIAMVALLTSLND